MKTPRSNSMPPALRSPTSTPTPSTQTLQRSPSAPELGKTPSPPPSPKPPGSDSSFNSRPTNTGSHVPTQTGPTPRPQSAPPSPTGSPKSPKTVSSSLDAEMARNKAQLGGAQSRNAPMQADAQEMSGRVQGRINSQGDKFELKYSNAELNAIQSHGKQAGLSQQQIDDMVLVGSRKSKPIGAEELKAQMTEHKKVMNQGFPHLFHNKDQFDQFSQKLHDGVKNAGHPSGNIVIQGSSLRTSHAGDIDVAVMANKNEFASSLGKCFGNKRMTYTDAQGNEKVVKDLNKMSYEEMQKLSKDIGSSRASNSMAQTFAHAVDNGCIHPSSKFDKPMSNLAKTLSSEFKEPLSPKTPNDPKVGSVSIVLQGGPFDTVPNMPISR